MLHFEYPTAFLLLLLIPLFYVLRKAHLFKEPSFFLPLSDWNGTTFEWKSISARFLRNLSVLFFICGFCALIVAIASPTVTTQEKTYTSKGAEIIFIVDISPSMAALDMNGTRLEAAKQTIREIIQNSKGTVFGLAALAQEAAIIVPPTLDHSMLLERLNLLKTGELGDGTALGTGISIGVYHLISSRSEKKSIILLTDGENNAGIVHPNTAAKMAQENNISVFVVGIGTRGRVNLEFTDPATGKTYAGTFDSAFDTENLKKLAQSGGGFYYNADNTAKLSESLKEIEKNNRVEQSYIIHTTDTLYYSRAAFFAFVFIALSWIIRRIFLREPL